MEHSERSQITRAKIICAALKLFSLKGYDGTTTKAIAKEAGISEVTLFRHFSSKKELLEDVVNATPLLPILSGLLSQTEEKPYEEALKIIAENFLGALSLNKELICIMHSDIYRYRYPKKIRRIYRRFLDEFAMILASWFSGLQERGLLRTFDAASGAKAFLGMFLSHFTQNELILGEGMTEEDTGRTVKEYVSIFVYGTYDGK